MSGNTYLSILGNDYVSQPANQISVGVADAGKIVALNAFGVIDPSMIGSVPLLTSVQLITGGDASGSPTLIGQYTTIQSALNAIPPGTNSTNVRRDYVVLIPPGTYDEDLTVNITNCHIQLTALGSVNIGLFDNTFWAASNTRNITIINNNANIDSIRSTFGMGTYIPNSTSSTTHPAYSTAFRLSGSIIVSTMPVAFTDIEIYVGGEIFGNIDTSAFSTHNFHLYLNKSRVRGQVKGTRNLLQMADDCTFSGLVTLNEYAVVRDCSFEAGMTVSAASTAGFQPWGMFACNFAGTFTGPANSMHLDSTSNYYFVLNGAVLAGGATQVMLENGAGGGISQLTGDVTAGPGSGSQVATIANNAIVTTYIANNAVTNAKLAQMPANTVKANITGGTANAVDVALSATATNNSVVQRDSSGAIVATAVITPLIKPADGAGTLLNLNGGTAASNGNGGNVTVAGAAGSNVGTGGNGGQINLNGGAANGDNTANESGGGITINAGASKGSSQGGGFTVNLGTGGPGTGTAGATGGANNINGGTGGIGAATSGAGGNSTLKGGTGGAGVVGGAGGTATLNGGTGGTGSSSGGNGGPANVSGGSPSNNAGSAGGAVTIAGAGGSSTGAGGAGGNVTITGGAANGDNTANNNGGNITLTCGNSKGSANGVNLTGNAGVGGPGTGTVGATGGQVNLNAGAGGVGSATGGTGGSMTFQAGPGGNSATPGAGGDIVFRAAATTSLTDRLRIVAATGEVRVSTGNLQIATAGNGLQIKSGAGAKIGQATLVAGTVTVANTNITTNSRIFLTVSAAGGTQGFLRTAKVAGTSFTITSTSATETSVVDWFIVESF